MLKEQEQIAQELKKEFGKGNLKPSQLKKSKSLSDLPKSFQPETLRRKSIEPLTNPKSLKKQLAEAQDKISILELKLETSQRELSEFGEENKHLKAQIEIKQKELESLREQLEQTNANLAQTQQELDASLEARLQGLKVFGSEHEKRVKSERELNNTVEEASGELINSDQTIMNLRNQIAKLERETKLLEAQKQSLTRDLDLSQRLIELRQESPFIADEFNSSLTYFKYGIYALLAVGFCLILRRRKN